MHHKKHNVQLPALYPEYRKYRKYQNYRGYQEYQKFRLYHQHGLYRQYRLQYTGPTKVSSGANAK